MTEICRYNKLTNAKDKREIVLLKSFPCKWNKCTFCDYIHDNSTNEIIINSKNNEILNLVTGSFGVLQAINSGSCFELPIESLKKLKAVIQNRHIKKLYLEAHWLYRYRLSEMKDFFGIEIIFMTGIETFDNNFRNIILNKNIEFENILEIKKYFQSACIMVGIQGQTKEMISNDVKTLVENFEHGTVNLFVNNSTPIIADNELQSWFIEEFQWLNQESHIDVLWKNTDFGVGTPIV